MNAIMKQQKQPNPNLESARRDSLREDGPARGQLLISPAESPAVALREKPAGKQEQQSRHRALFIPKEGKETLEVNLEKAWSRDQREWDRESVMRREGISTPTHPSYSTGSTLRKNRRKVAKDCSNTAHTLEENTRKQEKLTRQDIASWAYVVCQAQTSEST